MASPRSIEVEERIRNAEATLQEGEADRLRKGFAAYLSARDEALAGLTALVADTGDDPKKSDFDSKLTSARSTAMGYLNTMLDGVTPSRDAGLLRTQLLLEESLFLRDIEQMDLGGARDALGGFRTRLRGMIADLKTKWSASGEQTQRINELERQAAKDMAAAMKGAIEEGVGAFGQMSKYTSVGADWVKDIGKKVDAAVKGGVQKIADYARGTIADASIEIEALAKAREELSDAGSEVINIMKQMGAEPRDVAKTTVLFVRNPGMVMTDYIEDGLKAVTGYLGGSDSATMIALAIKVAGEGKKCLYLLSEPYRRAREAYTSQLPLQGAILTCFAQTRQDVDKFIQESGVDRAGKYYETIEDDISEFKDATRPSGLALDAAAFAEDVKNAMEARKSELERMFADFANANRGRFIGEIDDSTQRDLVDIANWNSTRDELEGIGLDRRLQEWRAQCLTITPEFENAWTQIQAQLAGLPVVFQARVRDAIESVHSQLRDQFSSAQDETVKLLDAPQKDFDPAELGRVFDRRPLVELLRK